MKMIRKLFVLGLMVRLAVLGVVLLSLSIPRIWRTSPPGITPAIRVSGLSLAKAWSMRRTARKTFAAGQFDQSLIAWRSAVSFNRADAVAVRGYLETINRLEARQGNRLSALNFGFWLLHLSGTNQADAELASRIFAQFDEYAMTRNLLLQLPPPLDLKLEAALLKALFQMGDFQGFGKRYATAAATGTANDPELPLYYAAYQMGWGPMNMVEKGRTALEKARNDPPLRVLATQLLLAVYEVRLDAIQSGRMLEQLIEWRVDRAFDHCRHWETLRAIGQKNQAAKLAHDYPNPPGSVRETLVLARTLARLELKDQALDTLGFSLRLNEDSSDLWLAYIDLLATQQKWADITAATVQMRQCKGLAGSLDGLSWFIEGQATHELGRKIDAEAAFQKACKFTHTNPEMDLRVAQGLVKCGRPELARALLESIESRQAKLPAYWYALFIVAYDLKDSALLFKAAESVYLLEPQNTMAINNYAAALITRRKQPEVAVKLTFSLLSQVPDSAVRKINHSLALLLNQRVEEAETLLKTVPATNLPPPALAAWQMAWCEVNLERKRFNRVLELANAIDRRQLFPIEHRWLDTAIATAQSALAPPPDQSRTRSN